MTPQAAVPAIAQTQADPSGVIAVAPQRAPDWYDPHKARCPWGLGAGFVVYVLLPLAATAWYLWSEAADQYAATTGFSVRAEDVGSAIELLGGVADLSGSSARSDADLLVAFIASQDMVRTLDARLDLRARWSLPDNDPIFAFDPSGTIEDLTDYWQRMVRVTHDPRRRPDRGRGARLCARRRADDRGGGIRGKLGPDQCAVGDCPDRHDPPCQTRPGRG